MIAPRRSPAALAGALFFAACVPPPVPASAPASVPASAPAPVPAPAPAIPRPLKEGIVLSGAAGARLHPVDGALFISTTRKTEAGTERLFHLARGDALLPQPEHTLPPAMAEERLVLAGRAPDRVFALIDGMDGDTFKPRVYRRDTDGWTEIPVAGMPLSIAWWSDQLIGLVRDPSDASQQRLARLDAPGPDLALPKAEGPACDAFFSKRGAAGFPRLAVQPRGLVSAGGQLFVLGYGCDHQLAVASWSRGSATPALHSIAEPMFMDGLPGAVVGRSPKDLWLLRPPMRPMALAALWHHDGAGWSKVSWPTEDPQVESADVDSSGTLWAAIDGKLYRRKAEPWIERPLPQGCEARSVSAGDAGSLWIACAGAVVRLAP